MAHRALTLNGVPARAGKDLREFALHDWRLTMHISLNRLFRVWLMGAAALWGVAAPAQVVRCTDARTGQVTYTDGDCARGTTVREVEARKTPEEIRQERAQAADALERKQQRLQAEAATARQDAERDAQRQREQAARAATTRTTAQDYARSPECARSRRNLDIAASSTARSPYEQDTQLQAAQRQMELDCLGPEGYAEVEKNRPLNQPLLVHPRLRPPVARPLPQPSFTQCNVFRCYDAQGRSYSRP